MNLECVKYAPSVGREPCLEPGEVAFLTVTGVTSFGAFVEWGPPKDLIVPNAEIVDEIRVGERHPIGLFVDVQGRPTGTMRVRELLDGTGRFDLDEWVQGEAWRKEPGIGVFVIVEKRYVGLLPEAEPCTLGRGDAGRFRIAHVHADGKIELTMRGLAHEERDADAERVLAVLTKEPSLRVSDRSDPEVIREKFALSKKAFKRAVGGLLKRSAVAFDESGNILVSRENPRAKGEKA